MEAKKIYIVASYNDTLPGKLICGRAKLKFWKRYPGDTYSHVSLSRDSSLNNMMSFARKKINTPLNAGLVKEDINRGMFALKRNISKIAVMEICVSDKTYDKIGEAMDAYWKRKDSLKFNFFGLGVMLFLARGVSMKNHYFCSQWVATVLQECDLDIFDGKKPYNIRPFDFYTKLQDNIIYEGLTIDYPKYDISGKKKVYKRRLGE